MLSFLSGCDRRDSLGSLERTQVVNQVRRNFHDVFVLSNSDFLSYSGFKFIALEKQAALSVFVNCRAGTAATGLDQNLQLIRHNEPSFTLGYQVSKQQ